MRILSATVIDEPTPTDDITLASLKEYLRVDYTADDSVITAMLTGAWKAVETYCNTLYQRRKVEVVFQAYDAYTSGLAIDLNPCYELPYYPNGTINSVKSRNEEGTETALTVNSEYYVIAGQPRQVIRLVSPITLTQASNPTYIVNYEAGYSTVPEPVLEAIKMVVAYMYQNRGNAALSKYGAINENARTMLSSYRNIAV